jgi:hypothetical protein
MLRLMDKVKNQQGLERDMRREVEYGEEVQDEAA